MAEQFVQETLSRRPSTDGVLVDDAGITISHRALKRSLIVPFDQIASVALDDGSATVPALPADDRVPARSPRAMAFLDPRLRRPTVVVLLRRPFVVTGVKRGQEKVLGVKGRERRAGAEVEALGFRPVDGPGLVLALERRGVPLAPSVLQAQIDLVGEATGEQAEAILAERDRARRRARRVLLFAYVMVLPLASARIELARSDAGEASIGEWLGINAVALACAVVVFGIVLAWPRRIVVGPPIRRDARAAAIRGRRLAYGLLVAILAALGASTAAAHAGVPAIVAFGPVLGLPLGVVGGLVRRSTRDEGPGSAS